MRSTRAKRKSTAPKRGSQRSSDSRQAEELRLRIARIQAIAAEEREAFLALYDQRREYHDQLREQLEYYLEQERRLLTAREPNGRVQ